jgi:valyl-tRNA synthetase
MLSNVVICLRKLAMQNQPQFGKDEQQYSLKEDLQPLLNEMLEIRSLFVQQLQQDKRREELSLQVVSQQRDLQVTNVVLQRLVKALDGYQAPDYEATFRAVEQRLKKLDETSNQLAKTVSQIDSSIELSRLEKKIGSLNDNVNTVSQTLDEQQELLQTNFDWKVLAAQIVGISLVTTTMLIIGLRIFPPNPLLDKELQVIYSKVEQLRKAKK